MSRHQIISIEGAHEVTPTLHTSVLSPRILSVVMRSTILPVRISHFLTQLSEQPATIVVSIHRDSSSSSSSSLSLPDAIEAALGGTNTGIPHARLNIRVFARSRRRRGVISSFARESNLIEPSSQPNARVVDVGFTAIDHIEPASESVILCRSKIP